MLRKNFEGRKNLRRKEAQVRQEERNRRTVEQQLKRLDDMGLNAVKERLRLQQLCVPTTK